MLVQGSEALSIEGVHAVLLASCLVLPLLLLAYIRQTLRARRIFSEFPLRRFESIELERAVHSYNKVRQRLDELSQRGKPPFTWYAVFNRARNNPEQHTDEIEDLTAHAQLLSMTIVRLRRQPLQRVKSWLHIKSSQFALAKAIQTHVASFMLLLIVALQFFDPEGLEQVVSNGLFGFPIDSLLYVNAVASLLAALAAPAFYMMQWLRLRRKYSFEFCIFKDLAQTDPAQRLEAQATDNVYPEPADSDKPYAMGDCFAVLGVAESASIEEVRKAYKKLMRQTHPDRVHDLSPALRKLAESETKTINAAYRQALASLPLH
jgi:DnaJ-domain-containing protein 1